MHHFSRRHFLASAAAGFAGAALLPASVARATASQRVLEVTTRVIEVNGKAAKVYALLGADGRPGLSFDSAGQFKVQLRNRLEQPTLIHWHGLTPPNGSDGVPGMTQAPLKAGASYGYDFPLQRPGTNFMHSHLGLQEQQLLAAPLIIRDPAEAHLDEQEVIILLHDFTFRDPNEILTELQKGMAHQMDGQQMGQMQAGQMQMEMSGANMQGMDMSQMPGMSQTMPISGVGMGGMDMNDIRYDAFLANDRTLDDPEIITAERGGRLRLRIINAGSASNFMIDLGPLSAELIAVDGMPVQPVADKQFAIAMGQRLDLRLQLPAEGGAWPVFAQLEGDRRRSAVVLATKGAATPKFNLLAAQPTGRFDQLTGHLVAALNPLLARKPDRRLAITLTGDMMSYRWGLATGESDPRLSVKQGERVEIEMINRTMMSHPMHLHGHHFQLVAVNGQAINGPLRDTHLVPTGSSATIAFDADNPGSWAFHCHNLYHMVGGMMTELRYL
jgi:FtsP/CotA-like multicopper oxidase with cupredoxin domain